MEQYPHLGAMKHEVLDSKTFELSQDQEVRLCLLEQRLQIMSRTQIEGLLVQTMRETSLKDNIIRDLLQALSV